MSEFYLFEIVAESLSNIEYDNSIPESIKKIRKESVTQLLPIFLEFHRQGFRPDLVKKAFEKKVAFVLQAKTKAEIKEIEKLSMPYCNYAEIVPRGQFHIEEEEMLLWFGIAPSCKLKPEAIDRICTLFQKLYPEEANYVLKSGGL